MKRILLASIISAVLLTGVSCASAKKRPPGSTQSGGAEINVQDMGPSPSVYPPGESVGPSLPVSYGPAPVQKKGIVLVLSSGGARGFAHIGVLMALDELKIPIDQIYGDEMGALFGALYTESKTKNDFEWQSQKFQAETFSEAGLSKWLKGGQSATVPMSLKKQIEKTFSEKKLEEPTRSKIVVIFRGHIIDRGRTSERVLESFEEGDDATAAEQIAGDQKTLWIDLGDVRKGRKQSYRHWLKTDQNTIVIQPELKGIGIGDYASRSEIIYRGKQAIMKKSEQLKKWIEP